MHDAAKALGIDRGNLQKCLKGVYRQTNGYEFEHGVPNEPSVLDGEEWRDVHDGARVSSFGRIQNIHGAVFTPKACRSGYVKVQVKGTNYLVHRLVADKFELPRTPGQTEVNHKDGDPTNNNVTNLEWVSKSHNVQHSYDTNKKRQSSTGRTEKHIRGRPIGAPEWTNYRGASDAARRLGLNHGNISLCCNGHRASTQGYEFEYGEPDEPDVLPGEEWRDVIV